MENRDLIAAAVSAPIDWREFERLAHSILLADDLPSLRLHGGTGDLGVDAEQEVFYDGQRSGVPTIVQISRERAQSAKLDDTLAKLEANRIPCKHLILVLQSPVSSQVGRNLKERADAKGVTLDIRDAEYLVAQLSKQGSPIFARFFGTAREQLAILLDNPDPLGIASSRLKRALLASLGAFVLEPRARLARGTLFEKTVLAALAASNGMTTRAKLLEAVHELLPDEEIDTQRLAAALGNLNRQRHCTLEGEAVACSEQVVAEFAAIARASENGYRALIEHVTGACGHRRRLDDAMKGYLERNIRVAILHLLRAAGPLPASADLSAEVTQLGEGISAVLARDLPSEIAATATAALSDYVRCRDNAVLLAPLVRSYATLAIRNIDPLGRQWQQSTLSRSVLALDTDAVLYLLVEDLPEHRPLLTALRALDAQGVRLIVGRRVLDEAISNVERADRTFRRFANVLPRLPESAVQKNVWHAVVRGYYYACRGGYRGTPEMYWRNYYEPKNPSEFIRFQLGRRVKLHEEDLEAIPLEWEADSQALEAAVLDRREQSRWKAGFRDENDKQLRVRADVRMILNLAQKVASSIGGEARGYLASEDRGFHFVETHEAWKTRPRVFIQTRSLPQLANFVCGSEVTDEELVRLLFNPAIAAAGEYLAEEIDALASIGVDLKEVSLLRLEYDISLKLRDHLLELKALSGPGIAASNAALERAVLATVQAAQTADYPLERRVEELAANYDTAVSEADVERQRRQAVEEKLLALAHAARETTKKGRRRINRILRDLDIELEVSEGPLDE